MGEGRQVAASHKPSGIRHRIAERREARAEKKFIRKEIQRVNFERDTPVFAVLEGVDPNTNQPPPYINVRLGREALTRPR